MLSTTSSSLTFRALLKAATSRTSFGGASGDVSGLAPAAKALFVAALAAGRPVFVVVPTDRDIEQMTADVRFFLAGLEGLADPDLDRQVLPLPSREVDLYQGLSPHFRVVSARARALHGLATGTARVVVASGPALLCRLSKPACVLAVSADLLSGGEIGPQGLADLLADAGFLREDPVDEHGEYCVRGGVVDFFPAGDIEPVRIEFVGDTIETIRHFDPATQRSTSIVDRVTIVPLRELFDVPGLGEDQSGVPAVDRSATIFDYLLRGEPAVLVVSEAAMVARHAISVFEQAEASYREALVREEQAAEPGALLIDWGELEDRLSTAVRLEELSIEGRHDRHVACQPAVEYRGRIGEWVADIGRARERGDTVVFVAATAGRAERTVELLAEHDLLAAPIDQVENTHAAAVLVATGCLSRGFRLSEAGLQLYAETDVFEEERRTHVRRQSPARAFLSDFRDLKVGDFVVHVDHGIGMFAGLRQIDVGLEPQEFVELRYAGDDKLFVPVERLDLAQKYSGAAKPALDRLGGTSWERAKTKVRRAMRDMAEQLLKLYAARKAMTGHAFSPDTHWQREFEDAFEYELTPDQQTAITDIKRDMEAPTPMDRLLCGDVGYGKTEVAMRAAFKAVMDGKQVALLAPTTVLAFQHLKTLKDRFAAFPVRIDMISRFRGKAEQSAVVADLAAGRLDIIIGTHRLLSNDVQFRDIGLLIVDEEQRFGVAHKERIKQWRRRVDVLTMTATPIPRTLNMSLAGIRDMSVIETPPKDRLSIQTSVVKFDQKLIAQAIRTEIERGGQTYFVHNRVESIHSIANLVGRLVPEARIGVAHGQMSEQALERVMVDFVAHRYDVLLATTIIENGLDIPNANTMFVNRADRYGLAQLYQLRGRVGRSDRRAYAYLLIPGEDSLSPVARKRLAAIREFSDLGSGFRVAALDLEIRGAGNLLGGEQSGHIEAVGFEMYTKLLEQTVRELKGEEVEDEVRTAVNMKIDLRIDERYIADMNQRLSVYRRIAAARSEDEIAQILEGLRDRYGPVPDSVVNLADYGRIRVLADRLRLESIDREGRLVVFKFRPDTRVDPRRLIRLVQERPDLSLTPPAVLKLELNKDAGPAPSGSWWTTRALAGEVSGGFSRAEFERSKQATLRESGAVFEQVSCLLAGLSDQAAMG